RRDHLARPDHLLRRVVKCVQDRHRRCSLVTSTRQCRHYTTKREERSAPPASPLRSPLPGDRLRPAVEDLLHFVAMRGLVRDHVLELGLQPDITECFRLLEALL